MDKKEFQNTFKILIDGLIDGLPVSSRLQVFAKKLSTAPETIQKWYDGIAAPANASRDIVINHLYAEQKKRELLETVKEIIKNNLSIEIKEPSIYDGSSYIVMIKIGKETISSAYFDVDGCNCN